MSLNISFQAVVMHVIIQCLQQYEKMFYCRGENISGTKDKHRIFIYFTIKSEKVTSYFESRTSSILQMK